MRGLRSVGACGNALGDLAKAGEQFCEIAILGIVGRAAQIPDRRAGTAGVRDAARCPDLLNDRGVGLQRPYRLGLLGVGGNVADMQHVRGQAPEQALILVMMRTDESRHHDGAGAVDRMRLGLQVRADSQDFLSLDQHVRPFEVSDLAVQGQYSPALQQDPPPGHRRVSHAVAATRRLLRKAAAGYGGARHGPYPGEAAAQEVAPGKATPVDRRGSVCSAIPWSAFITIVLVLAVHAMLPEQVFH
ncbi:hypothetical protein D3C81_1065250 [compost metagenome]